VRHNIVANFSGKAWATVLNLAFVPLYINLLGVEIYGLLGVLTSLTALLSLLDMGLSATLSRELSRLAEEPGSGQQSRDLVRTLETIYAGIGLLLGFAIAVFAPFIARHWINTNVADHELVESTLRIMGVAIAVQWPASLYGGALMGLQRQVELNIVRSLMAMLQHGGAIAVLLLVSRSVVAFFLWQALVGLITTVFLAMCLWKLLPASAESSKFDKSLLVERRQFAMGVTGISVVTIVLTQFDKIILSKMLTLEMFGYYMLAFNVANALHNLVTPISAALLPKFTQLAALGEKAKLAELYHKGCQLLSVLVLPVSTTVAFFSKEVLSLWLNNAEAVEHAHRILTLLMIGTALNALMTLPYTLQLAHGWTKLAFYKNLVAVIVLIPLMIWMVTMYQGIGAAWAWIILNLGYLVSEVPIMHQHLLKGEMGSWYRRDIMLPISLVAIIGLVSRLAMPEEGSRALVFSVILLALILSFTTAMLASDRLSLRLVKIKSL
jgi:O-antigen/teichoic acid export membrane protein